MKHMSAEINKATLQEQHADLILAALELAQRIMNEASLSHMPLPELAAFSYTHKEDPYSRQETLQGHWVLANSQRRGNLVINGDGSLMLEIDLICELPKKAGQYAESISVWGQDIDQLRAEITLMARL